MRKTTLIILIVLLVVLIIVGIRLKSFYNKLGFDFNITKFTLSGLLKGQLGITLDLLLDNKSSTSITIGNIYLEVYFENVLIAQTPVVTGNDTIAANQISTIKGFEINIFANKQSGDLIALYSTKQPINLEIATKFSFFGIPIGFLPRIPYTYSDYSNG